MYKHVIPSHTYLRSTANGNLRHHLESHHEAKYVEVCASKGWKIQLAKRAAREALTQTTLDLHTQLNVTPRPSFSPKLFLQHLVNFIVADDQVRLFILLSVTSSNCC